MWGALYYGQGVYSEGYDAPTYSYTKLPVTFQNQMSVSSGDGMSVTEKIR